MTPADKRIWRFRSLLAVAGTAVLVATWSGASEASAPPQAVFTRLAGLTYVEGGFVYEYSTAAFNLTEAGVICVGWGSPAITYTLSPGRYLVEATHYGGCAPAKQGVTVSGATLIGRISNGSGRTLAQRKEECPVTRCLFRTRTTRTAAELRSCQARTLLLCIASVTASTWPEPHHFELPEPEPEPDKHVDKPTCGQERKRHSIGITCHSAVLCAYPLTATQGIRSLRCSLATPTGLVAKIAPGASGFVQALSRPCVKLPLVAGSVPQIGVAACKGAAPRVSKWRFSLS